jgi:hypothetical protein
MSDGQGRSGKLNIGRCAADLYAALQRKANDLGKHRFRRFLRFASGEGRGRKNRAARSGPMFLSALGASFDAKNRIRRLVPMRFAIRMPA